MLWHEKFRVVFEKTGEGHTRLVNERGPPLARSELGWSGADAGGGGGGSPRRCCLPRWEGRVIALRALSGSSDRNWVPVLSSYRCPKRASERFDLWSKCDGTPSLAGVLGLIDLEVGVVGPSSRWLMANA